MLDRRTARRRIHRFDSSITFELRALEAARDNWHGILAFVTDGIVIGSAIYISVTAPLLFPFTAFVIGTRQRALATLLHESVHKVLCESRTLNFIIGCLGGWLVFQSYFSYRNSHVGLHHRYLGGIEDPDQANYQRQGIYAAAPATFRRKVILPVILGFRIWTAGKNLVRDRLLPSRGKERSATEKLEFMGFWLFWATTITALWFAGLLSAFLEFWILPYFVAFVPVNWIIELAEHFPIVSRAQTDIYMTRNRLSGPLERQLFGIHGEAWHLVHHLKPGIPFWNVATAHRILMRDQEYARLNAESGGLFTPGPEGQPSILSVIANQLREIQVLRAATSTNSNINPSTKNAA